MRDEEVGQPILLLQIVEQIEDLGSNGDIQRGHRFIRHDHPGTYCDRPCDHDALALTARKVIREPIVVRGPQAHLIEESEDRLLYPARRRQFLVTERCTQDVANLMSRIEG